MNGSLSIANVELSKELRVAMGYNSLSQFAEKARITNDAELIEIYSGKLKKLPNRFLLRKIADNSEGRVTIVRLYEICGYSEKDAEEDLSWVNFKPVRNAIYMVDFGTGEYGIQGGVRPAYIVSNDVCNHNSSAISVIPVTTRIKRNLPTHVILGKEDGMIEDSVIICEQITTISKRRFFYNGYVKYIGKVPVNKQIEIENALMKQLGLRELRFNEALAFEMIDKIIELRKSRQLRNTKTMVDILNDKLDELENYCIQYGKDKRDVYREYKRLIEQQVVQLA